MDKTVLVYGEDRKETNKICACIKVHDDEITLIHENTLKNACYKGILSQVDVFVVVIARNSRNSHKVLRILTKLKRIEEYRFTPIIVVCDMENTLQCIFNELHCYACFDTKYDEEAFKSAFLDALEYEHPDRVSNLYRYRNNVLYSLREDEIKFIEVSGKTVNIMKTDGTSQTFGYSTCKEILDELNSVHFFQVSRNTLVNDIYIKSIDFTNRSALISGGDKVSIGSAYVKRIKQRYAHLRNKQKSSGIRLANISLNKI